MATQPSGHSVDGLHIEVVRPHETGCRYRGSVSVERPIRRNGSMQLYSPCYAWLCTADSNPEISCTEDPSNCRYKRRH